MATLAEEAAAAFAQRTKAEQETLDAAREEMRQAARAAVRQVLVKKDPTTGLETQLTMTELGLNRVHSNVDPVRKRGLVVWSDGTVHLGAQLVEGETAWRVRLVRQDSGEWVAAGDHRIRTLAELGAALQAR